MNFFRNKKKSTDGVKTTNGSIWWTLRKSYAGPFYFSAIFRLASDVFLLSTPLLLGALISYIDSAGALWKGLFLTFMLFFVSMMQAVLNGQYFHHNFMVGLRIRTGVITAVYRKALRISSRAKRSTTTGEIVNLMSVDAQRFFELMPNVHMLWSGPLIIGASIYLLWQYLGYAMIAGLTVTIATVPLTVWIALKLKVLQQDQMVIKDERIKFMSEILSGMKVLKLYAWEPSFENTTKKVRDEEIAVLKGIALYNAGTYFTWSLAPFVIAMASFVTFVMMGEVLTPEIAFVSLTLFNILRFPMTLC